MNRRQNECRERRALLLPEFHRVLRHESSWLFTKRLPGTAELWLRHCNVSPSTAQMQRVFPIERVAPTSVTDSITATIRNGFDVKNASKSQVAWRHTSGRFRQRPLSCWMMEFGRMPHLGGGRATGGLFAACADALPPFVTARPAVVSLGATTDHHLHSIGLSPPEFRNAHRTERAWPHRAD